jgi:hypothetical protein
MNNLEINRAREKFKKTLHFRGGGGGDYMQFYKLTIFKDILIIFKFLKNSKH